MSNPAFEILSESSSVVSTSDQLWSRLQHLSAEGVPITPTIALQPETLQAIFAHHKPTRQHLARLYTSHLQNDFVRVCFQAHQGEYITVENILGETNLLDTIYQLAPSIGYSSLIIQHTPQPDFAGTAYTLNPATENKRQLLIETVSGAFDETKIQEVSSYLLDTRTQQLLQKSEVKQSLFLERSSDEYLERPLKSQTVSLDQRSIREITQNLIAAKRQFPFHFKISWHIAGGKLFFNILEPLESSASTRQQHRLLGLGTSLTSGFVQGTAEVVSPSQSKLKSQLPAQTILVTSQLTSKHAKLLDQVAAIITEKPITDSKLLTKITHFNLPCVCNVPFATTKMSTHTQLYVDASNGKVFTPITTSRFISQTSQHQRSITQNTAHKVIALTGNPHQLPSLSNRSEIALNSNYTIALYHVHPAHLANQHHSKHTNTASLLETNIQSQLEPFFRGNPQEIYYLPHSLSNQDLSQLDHSLDQQSANSDHIELRSAQGILNYPRVYLSEITAVSNLAQHYPQPKLNIILPFVQTQAEYTLLKALTMQHFPNTKNWKIWQHVTSPASFDIQDTTSLILDFDYIHRSWHGLESLNRAHYHEYPVSNSSLTNFITEKCKQSTAQDMMLLSRYYLPELAENAIHWNVSGIISSHQQTLKYQQRLHEIH